MNTGLIIILGLDIAVALAVGGALRWSGIAWRWPLLLAGIVGVQAAIVALMMAGHELGWKPGPGSGASGSGAVVAVIAATAARRRRAAAGVSVRQIGAVLALIVLLHVAVVGGLLMVHHYRHF